MQTVAPSRCELPLFNDGTVRLYTADNAHTLNWERYEYGPYLQELLVRGPGTYMHNASCHFAVLDFYGRLFPITWTSGKRADHCRLTSLEAHYIGAAQELVSKLKGRRILRFALGTLLKALRRISHLDRVVLVNNWLLSTNLYPRITAEDLSSIVKVLTLQFPDAAIAFCSLNEHHHGDLLAAAEAVKLSTIVNRQIVLLNKSVYKAKRQYKRDVKWWKNQGLYSWQRAIPPLSPELLQRSHTLFQDLYIRHHSAFNPDYTEQFIAMAANAGVLEFWQLIDHSGHCMAVTCLHTRNGITTNPFNGYDMSVPQEHGLYTAMRLHTIERAEREGLQLHMSSASVEHKRLRGGEPCLEYLLVYSEHLSLRGRLFWKLFTRLSRAVFKPLISELNS